MNEKQKAILKWLGGEQNIGKQKMLNKDRVEDSGEWILESVEYNKWLSDRESALICSGFGNYVPVICGLIICSWCWKIVYHVRLLD